MSASFRAELKTAVQPLHNALEQHALQKKLLAETCDVSHYHTVLTAYHLAFLTLEPIVEDYSWPGTCSYQARIPCLESDLSTLRSNPSVEKLVLPPDEGISPWGVRYVLEGMALGSQWMMKNISIFKNPIALEASRFFSLDTRRWPDFCKHLEHYCQQEYERKKAIESACFSFRVFQKAFDFCYP